MHATTHTTSARNLLHIALRNELTYQQKLKRFEKALNTIERLALKAEHDGAVARDLEVMRDDDA